MTTFRLDYSGFGRNVLNSDFMLAEMLARGENVLARAILTAPYDENDPDHIHYRDHFVLTGGKHGGLHHDRAYAQVSNNDSPTNYLVEFGSPTFEAYRTLRNALDGASGKIHGRTLRAIFKGTHLALPEPKPRKPRKPKNP